MTTTTFARITTTEPWPGRPSSGLYLPFAFRSDNDTTAPVAPNAKADASAWDRGNGALSRRFER